MILKKILLRFLLASLALMNDTVLCMEITKDHFSGSKPLFVMTVTRNEESVMLPSERLCLENIVKMLCGKNVDDANLESFIEIDRKEIDKACEEYKECKRKGDIEMSPYKLQLIHKKKDVDSVKESYEITKKGVLSRKDYSPFKDNVGIVVFNEMFFGKKAPYIEFQYKEILKEFKKISDQITGKLFCINVLGERKYNISPEYKDFVTRLVAPKRGEESRLVREDFLFDDDKTQISSYIDNAYTEGEHLAIENASFVFYHGEEVASYRKGSYFCESDWYLDHGMPYIFGNGKTIFSEDSEGELLSEHLSIQICRDVLCGIGECSPRGLLHIFQSNSLYFRADDMPKRAKTVVHADPVYSKQNGDFYCKRMVFNMDEEMFIPLRWENGGCPIFFSDFIWVRPVMT